MTTTSLPCVRTRAASTEATILRSARAGLGRRGGTNVSMRDIAAGAGITIGAIYKHFRDRDDLLDRVVAETFASLEGRLLRAASRCPQGSFARVVALGSTYITFAEEHPEEFKFLFSPFRKPRPLRKLPGRAVYDLLRTAVAEAIDARELRPGDPDTVAFFLWSRVHGIIMLLLACDFGPSFSPDGAPLTPQMAFEQTAELAGRGMLPSQSSRRTRRKEALGGKMVAS